MNNQSKVTLPGAGPFYFDGNDIGIVIIHGGGGGTCADLKPLGEDLHKKKGYTVHIPLLPGFGTSPEDLRITPLSAWKRALEREILLIREKCEKIVIGGHSMGGVFSLILASNNNIDGVFTISTPIGLRGFAPKLVPLLKIFVKYYPIPFKKFKQETNGKWVGYNKIPLNIIGKFNSLMKEMKNILEDIKCPAIFFQGRLDSIIKKNSIDFIYANVNSKVKKKICLDHNDHPILCSPDHDEIVSTLVNFIDEVCN
jgi:carboxylesterase